MTGEHVAHRSLLDAVGEDPDLLPEEKETTFLLTKPDDVFRTYTAEAGVARRLLAHPHVEIEGVTVADGDARLDVAPEQHEGRPIHGVRALVPVGCLSVRSSPRSSAGHAPIVSERVLQEVSET